MTRLASLHYSLFCCAALLTLALPAQAADHLGGKYAGMTFGERINAFVKTCPARFDRVDSAVAEANVGDPQYFRVPGYPFLRTNRLTAAYAAQVDSIEEIAYLLSDLRADAAYARNIELLNLGMPRAERRNTLHQLRLCAVWLSMRAEQRPEVRSKILQAIAEAPIAATADTPSTETQAAKQSSAPAATATQKVVYWAAAPDAELADMAHEVLSNYHSQRRDLFGRIGLAESEWKALAAYYAPRWAIHTAGPQDRLGRPVLRNGHTAIDHETPVVHYQVGYARAGGQTLVQIQYFAWFGGDDPNHFGGLVWRVTLDANGQPLVYDSIGMRGREHLWFPVHSLEIATGAHPTIPQAPISAGTPQLWLQSQSHRVRQVDAVQGGARPDAGHYALRRYERLFTLEAGADDTQSLFDPTGRVRGTGVQGAGLYHLSRLSLAPGEPWYFDDPDLLRHNFVLPASAVKASGHDQPERHTTN